MLCGSGRAQSALNLRCAQVSLAESRAFRRARLVPNQAPRDFAPGADFVILAVGAAHQFNPCFETYGSEH